MRYEEQEYALAAEPLFGRGRFAATLEEQLDHWDWAFPFGVLVDVKMTPTRGVGGVPCQCIEWTSVTGEIGWVRGISDWVAFRDDGKHWLHVSRKQLEAQISNVNWYRVPQKPEKDKPYSKIYFCYGGRRYQGGWRNDRFCYVPVADLRALSASFSLT